MIFHPTQVRLHVVPSSSPRRTRSSPSTPATTGASPATSGRPPSPRTGGIRGVAIIGRPVARGLDDGWTLEVTRLATDGCPNACSALYAAAWRQVRERGFLRLGTYILASEPGTSILAAGWRMVGEVKGRSWDCTSRPRVDKHPTQDKLRFEIGKPR